MITRRNIALAIAGTFAGLAGSAQAAEPIKIGIISHVSGPFAVGGMKYEHGIRSFLDVYGNQVGGRTIEIVSRDLAGGAPAKAKQLTEELIVRDRVSLIAGYFLSPESLAAAPTLTEAKVPGVVINGSALAITKASPFIVRPTGTMPQVMEAHAKFIHGAGRRKAYIAVSDYSPGHEVQAEFKQRFTARGGSIVGEERIALNTMDFSAVVERIAAAKPDIVELFVPNGAPSVAMTKALRARGLLGRDDLMIIGQGYIDEPTLTQYDDSIIGAYDAQIYALPAAGAENEKFKAAMKARYPDVIPSYEAASSYDAMHILFQMIRSQQGKTFNGADAVTAVTGWSYEGARGPQSIETSRNITTNVYIRKVVKKDGRLVNELVHTERAVPSVP